MAVIQIPIGLGGKGLIFKTIFKSPKNIILIYDWVTKKGTGALKKGLKIVKCSKSCKKMTARIFLENLKLNLRLWSQKLFCSPLFTGPHLSDLP